MNLILALLACARLSYNITAAGLIPPRAGVGPVPASDALGWLSAPQAVAAGLDAEDAAFVGVTAEGIVICARGTTPNGAGPCGQVFIDWLQDLMAAPMDGPSFPGAVHAGFYAAWLALWPLLRPLIAARAATHPDLPFLVTGHSKGGALAFLIAWALREAYPGREIIVRGFAPARVGDAAFARAFDAAIPDAVRFEFGDDVVPHVPSRALAIAMALMLPGMADVYTSAGALAYIRSDGSILGDSPVLQLGRDAAIFARLARAGGIEVIAADHSIDELRGYVTADYPH